MIQKIWFKFSLCRQKEFCGSAHEKFLENDLILTHKLNLNLFGKTHSLPSIKYNEKLQ